MRPDDKSSGSKKKVKNRFPSRFHSKFVVKAPKSQIGRYIANLGDARELGTTRPSNQISISSSFSTRDLVQYEVGPRIPVVQGNRSLRCVRKPDSRGWVVALTMRLGRPTSALSIGGERIRWR